MPPKPAHEQVLTGVHLWVRHESRSTERRAPITPADAQKAIDQGATITVETSPQRVFDIDEYAAAGCIVVGTGSWVDAPVQAYILGIKELPNEPAELRHTHIFFAHAYKGQDGAQEVLRRFVCGSGELIDVEYLTVKGQRVVAFGYWAGYVGASLSLLAHRGALDPPLVPTTRLDLDTAVARVCASPGRGLVIGARGRSGSGAVDALVRAGWQVTPWGLEHTRALDRSVLLAHDILLNCVVSCRPQQPFVTATDIAAPRRLTVIGDVTCDVTSANNLLPLNGAVTSWAEPLRRFGGPGPTDTATGESASPPPLDVIAIDNLPSLLPREASVTFSADFTPLLPHLADRTGAFAAAQEAFMAATAPLR